MGGVLGKLSRVGPATTGVGARLAPSCPEAANSKPADALSGKESGDCANSEPADAPSGKESEACANSEVRNRLPTVRIVQPADAPSGKESGDCANSEPADAPSGKESGACVPESAHIGGTDSVRGNDTSRGRATESEDSGGHGNDESGCGSHDRATDHYINKSGGEQIMASLKTVNADILHCGDTGRRRLGQIMSAEEREYKRNSKISAVVFCEKTSDVDVMKKPHCAAAFGHTRLLTEEEEITALLEVEVSPDITVTSYFPRGMGKKSGIDLEVWQGLFTIPEVALSGEEQIDAKNASIVQGYNNVSMVLRIKHLSVLFSHSKEDYVDEIEAESVKTCVSNIRTHCRHLRREVLALGGTPIREPVEYWRKKYPLAPF